MRSAALCLLAIATPACNWVFGLDATSLADGGPPGDGPMPTARLTWMIALTDPQGLPVAAAALQPIVPAPPIMAGRVDGPLAPLEYRPDGTFEVPYAFGASKYRFAYQLANDLPREIQWTPMEGRPAHAIVPVSGRLDRASIPGPNASYSLTPLGSPPAQHRGPRVLTTGIWTESQAVFPVPPGATFNYNFNSSIQLSGPPGAPERAKGDLVVLVDFANNGACRVSEGSAAFRVDLIDGASIPVTSEAWTYAARGASGTGNGPENYVRAARIIGETMASVVTTRTRIGPAPSTAMPAFTERVPSLGLRSPVILPLVDCTNADLAALPAFGEPGSLQPFEMLALHQLTVARTVPGGPTLEGGLSAVAPVTDAGSFVLDFAVAIPTPPFLLGDRELSTTDQLPLPAGMGPVVLTFGVEVGKQASYYDVVLHRVAGSSAIAERVYTVAEPTVTIDRAVFAAGTEYVLEIRAYQGAPEAAVGDFTSYLQTQSSAVAWTHTFVAP